MKISPKNKEFKSLPAIQVSKKRWIGDEHPCFIIAEVGQNHNGSMDIAKQLIDAISMHKADAVKLCKRDIPSELTKEMYNSPYTGPQSFGPTYGKHREFLELDKEQYKELKKKAEEQDLIFFATACDFKSVDDMEEVGVHLYKVASRDLTNLPLLDYMARTDKPIILSSGMDSFTEIKEALDSIRKYHDKIILLQCTSSYPTPYEDVHIRAMHTLRKEFNVLTGMSDHTIGIMVPVVAAALGAVVVEKHVTLARHMKGTDQAGSLEPDGLKRVVRDIRNVELALGDGEKKIPDVVANAKKKLTRSLVSNVEIQKGTILSEDMLVLKSPGTGIKWRDRNKIVGQKAKEGIPADVTLQEEMFIKK